MSFTVGDLRRRLEGLPDDMPVEVSVHPAPGVYSDPVVDMPVEEAEALYQGGDRRLDGTFHVMARRPS